MTARFASGSPFSSVNRPVRTAPRGSDRRRSAHRLSIGQDQRSTETARAPCPVRHREMRGLERLQCVAAGRQSADREAPFVVAHRASSLDPSLDNMVTTARRTGVCASSPSVTMPLTDAVPDSRRGGRCVVARRLLRVR